MVFGGSTSALFVGALLFLGGVFCGAQMLSFAIAKEGQDKSTTGTVTAFVNMIGIGAALIFQPLVGSLIDLTGGNHALALSSVPICLALAALLSLGVKEPVQPHLRSGRCAGGADPVPSK